MSYDLLNDWDDTPEDEKEGMNKSLLHTHSFLYKMSDS